MSVFYITSLFIIGIINIALGAEFTFELPDKQKQCFYEELHKDVKSTVEFQVITGGNYDVDIVIKGTDGKLVYDQQKKQYDSYSFVPTDSGVYQVCFSNEFSSFTHKVIYFEWQAGPEKSLKQEGKTPTAMTMMETNSVNIHESLNVIIDYQTHNRLREATGRSFAEELNERVLYWSLGQSFIIVLVGVGQVLVLRSFFQEKRTFSGVSS